MINPSEPATSLTSFAEKNNAEFEQIVARYFTSLGRLVQHHICTYPRLSIKGQTSPRSCFSGVLTSLLFGSRSTTAAAATASASGAITGMGGGSSSANFKLSSFDTAMGGGGGGNSGSASSAAAALFGGVASSMSSNPGGNGAGGAGGKQRSSLLGTAQSVLCNRDILVCLLLKFGINLLTDVKINFASILAAQDHPHESTKATTSSTLFSGGGVGGSGEHEFITSANWPMTSSSSSGDGLGSAAASAAVLLNNKPLLLGTTTTTATIDSGITSGNSNGAASSNSNFLEDDLLIQQLFLSDLQQAFDADLLDPNVSETFCCEFVPPPPPPPPPTTSQAAQTASSSSSSSSTNSMIDSKPPVPAVQATSANTTSKYASKVSAAKSITELNLKKKRLIRILSNECLEALIESLALCQSSALAMVISNSGYPIELTLDDIQTPGDGLFLLLKCIATMPLKLIEPAFSYLSKIKRLSEPLLWFFAQLFAQEQVVRAFIDRGGLDVVAKGLNVTTRQLLYSGPCIVSSLMNLIDSERQQMKSSAAASLDTADSTEGFTNFAPYGSIICTSSSGNPADVLLQNSAPHRRIRSAIWSYHFQPNDEHKVINFSA